MQKTPKAMLKLFMKLYAHQMGMSDRQRMKAWKGDESVRVEKDIPYVGDGNKGHLLDVFHPSEDVQADMMVIDIHGGGLFYGSKEINEEFNSALARQGCLCISLNYRLAPETGFLGQLSDILTAFQWIADRQAELGCDPERVCVAGDSAGALLAFYAAAINANPSMQQIFGLPGTSLKIKALGLISGMFYLNRKDKIGRLHPILFEGNYKEAAYLPYINPRRVIASCDIPPCYLVTSEEDMLKDYTLDFNAALEKYRCSHQMHCWAKGSTNALVHVFGVSYPQWEESRQTIEEMMMYFREWCAKETEV